jgi:hypothetical protein
LQIEAKRAIPKDEMVARSQKTKKIFVGGLNLSTTEGEFFRTRDTGAISEE